MMRPRMKLLLAAMTIAASLSALALVVFVDYGDQSQTFVWVYRFSQKDNHGLVQGLSKLHADGIFLSVSSSNVDPGNARYDPEYTVKVVDFLRLAHEYRITVHALVADEPVLALSANHETALNRVNAILSFNQNHSDSRFQGIQLDIEPFLLNEWSDGSWAERTRILQQYTELLSKAKQSIKGSDQTVVFSTVEPWRYASIIAEGELPLSVIQDLGNFADWLVLMIYDISPSRIPELAARLEPFVNCCKVMLGLKADDYHTYEELKAATSSFRQNLSSDRNLVGFSIFEYDRLSEMLGSAGLGASDNLMTIPLSCHQIKLAAAQSRIRTHGDSAHRESVIRLRWQGTRATDKSASTLSVLRRNLLRPNFSYIP